MSMLSKGMHSKCMPLLEQSGPLRQKGLYLGRCLWRMEDPVKRVEVAKHQDP